MKRFIKTALTVVLAVAAVSCAKEIEPQKENINGTIDLTITGAINGYTPQEETKAEAQTVVRIMWKGDETVYVFDGTKCLGSLTASIEGKDSTYAKLSGTISATQATTLTFVYSPQFSETQAPTITAGKISLDLSTQNDEEVPFLIYATLPTDQAPAAFSNDVVQFNLATSVFKCNCAGLVGDDDISKAVISGVNTKCELTLSDSGVPTIDGTTPGTITRTETAEPSVFTQADQRAIFSVAVVKTDASAERNILVHQGSKVSGAPFTTITLAAGKSYNTVYQMGEYIAPPAGILPGEFTIASGKKIHFSKGNVYAKKDNGTWTWHFYDNQYGYNSLNSQCEDGSRSATEGDTEIDLFTWGYNAVNSINPTYDDYEIGEVQQLSKSDDWGYVFGGESSAWRTLSIAEWRYLFAWTSTGVNTDTESPRYNHYKYGVTVCGTTNCVVLLPDDWNETIIPLTQFADITNYDSASIPTWKTMEDAGAVCLPAAGSRNGSAVSNVGTYGSYWSSSGLDVEAAYYVRIGNWQSDDVNLDCGTPRTSGFSVRLVTEASGGYAPKAPEVPVESISLSETELELMEGLSKSLTVTFTPEDATKKAVFWSSDNTSVATVDQTGKVSAVSVGTATITAVADGLAKASCEVTVSGLSNNVIIYKAAEMLGEFDPNDEDETPGIHTDAFSGNSITSHTFNDGIGIITFENDVVSIGEEAFYGCAMTYVGIPASVKEIGDKAFYECEELEQVFIAGGSELETIGESAFYCSALTSFNIPASVTKIDMAFYGCENLTKVTFANDCAITSIGESAFAGCGFTSITIPASVTTIGQFAFYASALTSINISASVTEIGGSAFEGCNSLAEVTFADDCNITSIKLGAFIGCGFTSITIPATVTTIGKSAFYASALTSINIPASVTEIGTEAFRECEDLTVVTFADNGQLSSIGESAFIRSGVTSINIPATVTEIGEKAFEDCFSLTEVKVNWDSENKIPLITDLEVFGAFDGELPSRTLYVPSGMVETYKNVNKGWGAETFGTITDGNPD